MEREFESKGLISKTEFNLLLENLNQTEIKNQTNTYIDTTEGFFKNQNSALRLRIINGQYIFSLKRQDDDGATEWNQPITKDEYTSICNSKSIDLSNYKCPQDEILTNLQINTITTTRYVCQYKDMIIELDETDFDTTIDYEIEIEAKNVQQANQYLTELSTAYNLDIKKSYPKIARYFMYN